MKLVLGTVLAMALSNVSFANENAAGHCEVKGNKNAKITDEAACTKAKGKWTAGDAAAHGEAATADATHAVPPAEKK
jgi:hypothetical protein